MGVAPARKGYGGQIGISLGTTNSCVGVWDQKQDRDIEIIETTPSVVAFTHTGILFGHAAKNRFSIDPINTVAVADVKYLIGKRYSDASVQHVIKRLPFKVIGGEGDELRIVVTHKGKEEQYTAEGIISMLLGNLKEITEAHLPSKVNEAVIAVPAYFDDSQIQAIKTAGIISGFEVVDTIEAPAAAVIAYGLDNHNQKNVLIFHLGGATCYVSFLSIERGKKLVVKATAKNVSNGGQDFDSILVDHFFKPFENTDLGAKLNALPTLKTHCERAKCELSDATCACLLIEDINFFQDITRSQFEGLIEDFLNNQCMKYVDMCLRDAKMDKSSVDEIILSGASTRIPKVQELLKDKFGNEKIRKSIDPDKVVAYGAFFHAASLNGCRADSTSSLIRSAPLINFSNEVGHVCTSNSFGADRTVFRSPQLINLTDDVGHAAHASSSGIWNKIISGEGGTPGELLHKSIAKTDHPAHYELKLEDYTKPYNCSGCKEIGFGSRFKCKHCDFELHKNCMVTPLTVSRNFFEQDCHFTFLDRPPKRCSIKKDSGTYCNACGMPICGFAYHCAATRWYLHPYCLDLKNEVVIEQSFKFKLHNHVSSKCDYCEHKKIPDKDAGTKGWSYEGKWNKKKQTFHVHCTTTMLFKSWKYGSADKTCVDLENMKLINIQDTKKKTSCWEAVTNPYNIITMLKVGFQIAVAMFGGPIGLISMVDPSVLQYLTA